MKWWILLLALGLLVVSAKTKDTDGDGIADECKLHLTILWYITKRLWYLGFIIHDINFYQVI